MKSKILLALFFLVFSSYAKASITDVAICVNVNASSYTMLKNFGDENSANNYLNNYIKLKMVGEQVFGKTSFDAALKINTIESSQPDYILSLIKSCLVKMEVFAKQYAVLKDLAECSAIFTDLKMEQEAIALSLKALDVLDKDAFTNAFAEAFVKMGSTTRDAKLSRVQVCKTHLSK